MFDYFKSVDNSYHRSLAVHSSLPGCGAAKSVEPAGHSSPPGEVPRSPYSPAPRPPDLPDRATSYPPGRSIPKKELMAARHPWIVRCHGRPARPLFVSGRVGCVRRGWGTVQALGPGSCRSLSKRAALPSRLGSRECRADRGPGNVGSVGRPTASRLGSRECRADRPPVGVVSVGHAPRPPCMAVVIAPRVNSTQQSRVSAADPYSRNRNNRQ